MVTTISLLAVVLCLVCGAAYAQENTLTPGEKTEGWTLLFDGASTKGWHTYNKAGKIGKAWTVSDGSLTLNLSDTTKKGGDIVTDAEYSDFELQLDWKIEACGNSGVIFNVAEGAGNSETYFTGPELQVLDNACHPDAKIPKHRAGNLYDLIASKTESVKPAGEWNHYRIVSNKGSLEVWLNGAGQVKTQMFTPEWEALIKGSKFRQYPDFGKAHKGRIAFQDHGNQVWFRNVKIKPLK